MSLRVIFATALLCVLTTNGAHSGQTAPGRAASSGRDSVALAIPPGLAKVMAEGAGRVANMTCADVRAVVAWIGEARAVEMAREAGAGEAQIAVARQCLTKKVKK